MLAQPRATRALTVFAFPRRRYAEALIVELVKPLLFVSKVPVFYGTIISGIIVSGAIFSVSAMLSSSGPSPSSTASAAFYLPARRTSALRAKRSASSLF